jgi:uncharacterized protein YwgA
LKRTAWALLALAASPDYDLSRVQLQKALFLFGKGLRAARVGDYYTFRPYHYGPYDPAVYNDLEELNEDGLVEQIPSAEYSGSNYCITPRGLAEAKRAAVELGENNFRYIVEVIEWIKPLTFSELVSAIYERYPTFKKNSIFRSTE